MYRIYWPHTHTSILYNSLSAALNIPSRKLALDIRSLHSAPKAWSISCDTDHISSFKDICFNWLKLFETPILDVNLPYVSWFCPLCFMAFSHFDDSDVQVLLDFAGRAKLVDFGCCKKAGSPTDAEALRWWVVEIRYFSCTFHPDFVVRFLTKNAGRRRSGPTPWWERRSTWHRRRKTNGRFEWGNHDGLWE